VSYMQKRFIALGAALIAASSVYASDYPSRPVTLVVPYTAGGAFDVLARLTADAVGKQLGANIVIENKPGAGGVIGADHVAKAAADGYTVLYDASAFSVNPTLRKTPYDATADFIPVALAVTAPQILVVPPDAPWQTFAEFADHARQHPDALSFASAGAGTGSHLAAEALSEQAGIRLLHVPYKGGAQALTDVMGGQVSAYFGNAASTLGYVRSGKLKALAVSSAHPVAGLPEVPTLAQAGLPGYNVVEWNGVFLPRGTPPEIVDKLNRAVRAAITDAGIQSRLTSMGLVPADTTPDAFARFVQDEIRRVATLLQARNITLD